MTVKIDTFLGFGHIKVAIMQPISHCIWEINIISLITVIFFLLFYLHNTGHPH